ncbi:hypothetical protein CFP56_030621 [Quercus suber]|uniref:Uncharacterized protein n=1 Tax=Quercus suber TaxID=58331 RepID=A0AAW0LU99_QUESU
MIKFLNTKTSSHHYTFPRV